FRRSERCHTCRANSRNLLSGAIALARCIWLGAFRRSRKAGEAPSWQAGGGGAKPGGPSRLGDPHPKQKRIGGLDIAAECLERGDCQHSNRKAFCIAVRRATMNDLDVEIWQSRGCPGFVEMASLHCFLLR